MKIEPINNMVLMKPIKEPKKTKSGIYIPESVDKGTLYAEIVSCGNSSLDLQPGSKVVYDGERYKSIVHEGQSYILIPASDIIAYIEECE